MPNFCPECGNKIEGMSKFCNECGHSIQGEITSKASGGKSKYPWLFTGAFSSYHGMATFEDVKVTMELSLQRQVAEIDQNNNKVKIQSNARMITRKQPQRIGFFPAVKGREKDSGDKKMEEWMRIGDRVIFEDNAILEGESKGTLRLEKLGIRKCIIEQYKVGQNTEIIFWDEEFSWPLKYIVMFTSKGRQKANYLSSMANLMTGDLDKSWDDATVKTVLKERAIVVNMTDSNIPWGLS